MKISNKLFSLSLMLLCLGGTSAFADSYQNSTIPTDRITILEQNDEKKVFDDHGFTRGDMVYLYSGKFEADKMVDVSGKVDEVLRVQFPDKDCYLIAVVSTANDKERMAVNLGPVWFLNEKDFMINEGDNLQLKGAKMRSNGRNLLIATEITKNGKTLNIRDKEGSSLWGSPKVQKGSADCMKLDGDTSLWPNNNN